MIAKKEYKLNVNDITNLKDGDKVEATVDGLDNTNVLLVKVNGQLKALGPKCTHYGAPLVKGVVMDDGHITCPWHGACFNTSTGEVENSPALDKLLAFELFIRDGIPYVLADEAALKAGREVPGVSCSTKSNERVIIVGGGSGAIGVIEGIREKGFPGKVIVLSKESYLPIDRTKLSKVLITDVSKVQLRSEDYLKDSGVEFHPQTEVESVNFKNHKLRTKDGQEWQYNKVIFATGGTPKKLPMEGFKTLHNIFVLRGIDDVERILKAVGDNGKKVVIIGSSFIGMEVGKCLSGKKNNVTIIGKESAPLERVMGKKIGEIFQHQLEKTGVKFFMNAEVEDAKPSASNRSQVGSVALKSGERIDADLVILGVGVAPATEYLKNSGLNLEKDGGVAVDDHWRINGVEDAYAVGDIATYPFRSGMVRIEHWNVAQDAGRQVGRYIGYKRKPVAFTPIFWSALGAQLRYCGHSSPGCDMYDDVVIHGEPAKDKWVAYYTAGDRVVAVASQGFDPVVTQSAELMRRKSMPSKTQIIAGLSPLDVYPPAVAEAVG